MTWILAHPTFFGQVLALSDIQVTFTDSQGKKTYRDCLQKMYALDKNFIAGFAGNVYGGFALLSKLSKAIKDGKKGREDLVVEPEGFINSWAPIAKKLYSNLIPEASNGGVHLLMGGVSSTKDNGIPGEGRPYVATLRSPEFIPEFAKTTEWISIGSGSDINEYIEILKKLSGEKIFPLAKMEIKNPGGFASAISIILIMDVQKEAQKKGISKHFHVAIVDRSSVRGGNSDHTEFLGDAREQKITMPPVATNLDEFEKYVKSEFGSVAFAEA